MCTVLERIFHSFLATTQSVKALKSYFVSEVTYTIKFKVLSFLSLIYLKIHTFSCLYHFFMAIKNTSLEIYSVLHWNIFNAIVSYSVQFFFSFFNCSTHKHTFFTSMALLPDVPLNWCWILMQLTKQVEQRLFLQCQCCHLSTYNIYDSSLWHAYPMVYDATI